MDPKDAFDAFSACGVTYYTGVPDSLLTPFCTFVTRSLHNAQHVIASNEGNAIALAAGHYLATGSLAVVYMQNSGLGNAINPLTSIADKEVYGIPLVLMIGWRGEVLPDKTQMRDEPQHTKMGRITEEILNIMNIPYAVIDAQVTKISEVAKDLVSYAYEHKHPVALLVRKGTFEDPAIGAPSVAYPTNSLSREDALEGLLDILPSSIPIVCSTGMISRELFELRVKRGEEHFRDFLAIGAMGHASQIAVGIANAHPGAVVCIEGDGSVLMHMGALALNAQYDNLIHVVLNNGAHDSVGGQPTLGFNVDLCAIAKACGYAYVSRIHGPKELALAVSTIEFKGGAVFLEVRCRRGAREDLGRPTLKPVTTKEIYMRFLSRHE